MPDSQAAAVALAEAPAPKLFDLFDSFAVNETKANKGTRIPLGPDSYIVIAQAGNREHSRLVAQFMEQHKADYEKAQETKDQDAEDALNMEMSIVVAAGALVKGWKNLAYKDEVLEFNDVNLRRVLRMSKFRNFVYTQATNEQNYAAKREDDEGNV